MVRELLGFILNPLKLKILIRGLIVDNPPFITLQRLIKVKNVKILLDHGANIHSKDNRGQSALHYASNSNFATDCTDCIKILLEHGANPYDKDNDGATPFDLATEVTKAFFDEYFCEIKEPDQN
jgi:hypothetical protein